MTADHLDKAPQLYFEIGMEGGSVTVFRATIDGRVGFWETTNTAVLDDLLESFGETPNPPRETVWLGATLPEALDALDFRWWNFMGLNIREEARPVLEAAVKRHGGNWKRWSRLSS